METKELIKYIYETDFENTVFEDNNKKGDRALILLSKYGEKSSEELKKKFGEKVNFNNITPATALKLCKEINLYLKENSIDEKINGIEPTLKDYKKFKKILEKFIQILRLKNKNNPEELIIDELKLGKGDMEYSSFSNGRTMAINSTEKFKSCYINWSGTSLTIREIMNEEKTDITALKLYFYDEDEWFGEEVTLSDLGLNDNKAPNDILKKFYKDYLDLLNSYSSNNKLTEELTRKLLNSKNIILRGAPGTGKTYLARQIAAYLIGVDVNDLDECEQYEFVQFHPSYDYTDFVEGLRPVNENGQVGFEPKNGIFKEFCIRASLNKSNDYERFDVIWESFINDVEENETVKISSIQNGKDLVYSLNSNLNLKEVTNKSFSHSITKENVFKVWQDINGRESGAHQARMKAVVKYLEDNYGLSKYEKRDIMKTDKKYVFVIDEINRGEISKIFGELFFAIDPGYRGKEGAVSTQYSNLFEEQEKFYIPDNVYIIGTMNDIDRSVDSFDFAMRRRFRFIKIKAEDSISMWDGQLKDNEIEIVTKRFKGLNHKISSIDDLNSNYHIGPSYFLKLKDLDYNYDVLWSDYLQPLLEEYLRGSYEEKSKLEAIRKAYYLEETLKDYKEYSYDEN